jgi:hypothetical protein
MGVLLTGCESSCSTLLCSRERALPMARVLGVEGMEMIRCLVSLQMQQ